MARRRGARVLVVGQARFLWSVGHAHLAHPDGSGMPDFATCRETLRLRRDGSRGRLDVVFRGGAGRLVPDGMLHGGAVWRVGSDALNLNEPGVVRALLDGALAGGWDPGVATNTEIDGWSLYDAALARGADA